MGKTMTVAWREFKSTALTKAFIIAAIFVPVALICLGVLGPMLFNPKPPPLKGTIAIIDPVGRLTAAAKVEFQPEKIRGRIRGNQQAKSDSPSGVVQRVEPGEMARNPRSMSAVTSDFDFNLELETDHQPGELEALKARVLNGTLVAIVAVDDPPPQASQPASTQPATTAPSPSLPRMYVPSGMNIKHTGLIEDSVQAAMSRARIEQAGMDVETVRNLARSPNPTTIRVSREGVEKTEGEGAKIFKVMLPMGFMMLIWMGAFVSANYLLTTTIEEKSNKVMEVLLSAVSPMQLMSGKIIGQALVGLVMIGMYLAMAIAGLTAAATADLIEWQDLMFFGLYYIMAYFMIASIMAAIGSAVNELREAQSLMTPAMVLLMIPLMLWLPISDSPNGTLATVTSFIPPLIPFVMILRVTGSEPIPMWQVIASLAIGFPAMLAMIWMAAKIFRVGVLMTGKPPSPMELLRWLRYS